MEKLSSAESEGLFPKITSSSPVPELIKFLKFSFMQSEFNEVQNILTDRENNMKVERENLERDRLSIKKELDLMERSQGLLEQNKLKLEGQLEEKNKTILELNEKIKELKNQKLETEKTAMTYEEKIKSLNLRAANMNEEVEKSKLEKLEADQTLQVYKKSFEHLSARFGKVEQILAKIFNVGVNDLLNLANNIDKDVNFSTSDGKKKSPETADFNRVFEHFRKERSLKNGADEGHKSPVVHSACEFSGSGLPQRDHGERVTEHLVLDGSSSKMAQSLKSGDIINISDSDDETIPEKFIQSPSFSQTNKKNRADYKDGSLMSSMPKRKRSTYGSDNDENFPTGSQQGKRTREVNYDGSVSFINDLVKPKSVLANLQQTVLHNPVLVRRCEENAKAKSDFQTPSQAYDGVNVEHSTDSEDESFSSSCINNIVASFQVKKKCKTWMFGADMLKAFEEDPELCLNAVCALYRQQISAANFTDGLTLSKSVGLFHCDATSIRSLGEYLIEGDPQHRLRKSVSEVEQQRPDVLRNCQKLAINYYEKLFDIYCKGKDPFYGPR
ncbi:Uncharacterized protein Adt_13515 [Abeliophyllum distichum]|uniref:Uncharacterized protein n=1 Tax=Abeliophyllum distichum TaxID=126358 RepID=A0ABD1TXH8_9LAMI